MIGRIAGQTHNVNFFGDKGLSWVRTRDDGVWQRQTVQIVQALDDATVYDAGGQLGRYDYYLSFEEIEAVPQGGQRSCTDVFSACLRTPQPARPASVIVPQDVRKRWKLAVSSWPRVALHVGLYSSFRSYPLDLVRELTDRLLQVELEVYLIGTTDGRDGAFGSGPAHDLLDKTPTPADLATVVEQMQAVVTNDSFPLHLAGALSVPTLAIFTSTDAVIGANYPSVTAWQSDATCSPCRQADGVCPLGHHECVAHRAASLSPRRIVEHVRSVICAKSVMRG